MSNSRVPGPTCARSNSASLARRAYGSTRYAQSAARSPQAWPDSAHPIGLASAAHPRSPLGKVCWISRPSASNEAGARTGARGGPGGPRPRAPAGPPVAAAPSRVVFRPEDRPEELGVLQQVAIAEVVLGDAFLACPAHLIRLARMVEQQPHVCSERGQVGRVGQQDAGALGDL